MTSELLSTISEVEDLLKECGWGDHANWLQSKRTTLQNSAEGSRAFRKELRELQSKLVGMGSLSDLPMSPNRNSKLTQSEADQKLYELVSRLGDTIRKMLGKRAGAS